MGSTEKGISTLQRQWDRKGFRLDNPLRADNGSSCLRTLTWQSTSSRHRPYNLHLQQAENGSDHSQERMLFSGARPSSQNTKSRWKESLIQFYRWLTEKFVQVNSSPVRIANSLADEASSNNRFIKPMPVFNPMILILMKNTFRRHNTKQ